MGHLLLLNWSSADGGVGQAVGFGVIFAGDVRDGEAEGAGEFATGPMQGVEAGAAADVFAAHLADDDFRIGVDVEGFGFRGNRVLEGFHESDVFGDVIVLMADPFGDADGTAGAAIDDDANTGRPGITQGTAVHIRHQF
jgi:hypothetical protein